MPESRPSARARGYTTRWDKARATYLAAHPHCATCALQGLRVEAEHVDHIRPHRGDQRLFWDKSNWQPLCTPHHNSTKQKAEHRGYLIGCDTGGRPIDLGHPWNRRPGG